MKALKLLLLLFALNFVLPLSLSAQDNEYKDLLQKAFEYFEGGRYGKAKNAMDAYCQMKEPIGEVAELRKKIEDCNSLNRQAGQSRKDARYHAALQYYERIRSINPGDPRLDDKMAEIQKLMDKPASSNGVETSNVTYIPPVPDANGNYMETVSGINLKMVYVEGGVFKMGCTSAQRSNCGDDEMPVRYVRLNNYYIAAFELTREQYVKIMRNTSNQRYKEANEASSAKVIGSTYPMTQVSWEDANSFCEELSRQTGKKYRLPTEAEWEYAARGGCKGQDYEYSGSFIIENVAWYTENSEGFVHPVGRKRPNGLGIYDMSGNVWEWCLDWYSERYLSGDIQNPKGASSGIGRVLRGGGWDDADTYCRVSARYYEGSDTRDSYTGFRVVCEE
ncbi:MAG: formylglycine-generating enzyme family protein [Bacteroides sp.]|nr:formylglycine-generating enzyme family protein [Bacteroides sp.]